MKEMETECGFRGTFITSCKTGKNVDKAIRFLSGQMVADLIRIKRKKAKAKANRPNKLEVSLSCVAGRVVDKNALSRELHSLKLQAQLAQKSRSLMSCMM